MRTAQRDRRPFGRVYRLAPLVLVWKSAAYDVEGSADGRGWLEREIEREYQQVRDAALADPEKTFTNDDFERTVDDLRAFARQRGDFVTREVNAARQP